MEGVVGSQKLVNVVCERPLILIYVSSIIHCFKLGWFRSFCMSQSVVYPRYLGDFYYHGTLSALSNRDYLQLGDLLWTKVKNTYTNLL